MKDTQIKLIQSVQRAIDILNCFNESTHYLSINTISQNLNLNINTTRGLINTLLHNGLLIHDKSTGLYSLGFYFIGKAEIIQKQVDNYIAIAKTHVNNIAEKYHISSSFQLVNQNQIYSIYCAYPNNTAYTISLSQYTTLPLYATSSGKLLMLYNLLPNNTDLLNNISFQQYTPYTINTRKKLLQNLKQIQANSYACEIEEFQLGVGSMAVPILNKKIS